MKNCTLANTAKIQFSCYEVKGTVYPSETDMTTNDNTDIQPPQRCGLVVSYPPHSKEAKMT